MVQAGRKVAGLLVFVAQVLLPVDQAGAHNEYGKTGDTADCVADRSFAGNIPDPNPHTFFYKDLTEPVRSAMEWARLGVVEPTRFDTVLLGAETEATDVVAMDQDYSTYCGVVWHPFVDSRTGRSTAALIVCRSIASNGACESTSCGST